jgi:peptidoglycan-associated lipoprotein
VTPDRILFSDPLRPRDLSQGVLVVALVALLAGCSSEPTRAPVPEAPASRPTPTAGAPAPVERPTYRGPWEDPSSPLYQRTIYFDYDSDEIKPEYIALMRNHAAYLGANTSTRVTLEGHTDERGTREYNLALGDQRAESVRRFMTAEGVIPDQMATLSYGEERPADPGRLESAWQRNRRVMIQY